MSDSLYIIVPAYNEQEALPAVLDEWYPYVAASPENRLVVLNDGSTDNTMGVINEYKEDHPQLIAIDKANSGHGATIYEGYQFALKENADYIFQTDSDGQTSPSEFASFWEMMQMANNNYDVIMGCRTHRQDGLSRVFVMNALRLVLRATMHVSIQDANVPYRLMRRQALERAIAYVPDRHSLTNVLLSASFFRLGMNVEFVPISFTERQGGTNSVNLKRIIGIGASSLSDFLKLDGVFRSGLND